jgi:hypothetical protein
MNADSDATWSASQAAVHSRRCRRNKVMAVGERTLLPDPAQSTPWRRLPEDSRGISRTKSAALLFREENG